jgi:hypothetical protein
MELPKKTPQGQSVQENSQTLSSDQNSPLSETGPVLKFGLVNGKQGEVRKLGMAQTDWTNDKGGPAPLI